MKFALLLLSSLSILFISESFPQTSNVKSSFKIARLKYAGGGDWYNDPQEEVNLLKFVRQNTLVDVDPVYEFVEVSSDKFFTYPFIFLTGHGNMSFTDSEVKRLRTYLENGGFIYADDDYGMDKAFRREVKKIFPEQEFVELPYSFGLYHCQFDFSKGPPKSHEHDGKPPQGFGLFHNGRLVLYYTYESNPSDAWNDPEVHGDSPEKRQEALQFGTNIVVWALTH
ncbi:MAG TPA: DUF4159 domain-containing protein [Bacteroidota bacterium]|jgi:hypothetical protein|nr:DUF4159 domain-containing protein [Bacteroidota bacterium]